MPVKCVIYARFSPRPNAAESESNLIQVQICRDYAKAKGYEVVEVHEDANTTGGVDEEDANVAAIFHDRPGLAAALKAMTRGMVLLVRWRSRLARSQWLSETIRLTVKKAKARIEAVEEVNGDTPDNVMLQQILASVAEHEKKVKAAVTKISMIQHQRNGRRMCSAAKLPYGFTLDPADPSRLVKDAYEQSVIFRMEDLKRFGLNLSAICRELDKEGLTRRGGKPWTGNHILVRDVLKRGK